MRHDVDLSIVPRNELAVVPDLVRLLNGHPMASFEDFPLLEKRGPMCPCTANRPNEALLDSMLSTAYTVLWSNPK
jgi:hypothetical protein